MKNGRKEIEKGQDGNIEKESPKLSRSGSFTVKLVTGNVLERKGGM